jgi:DNA primase (bacterial type)
MNAKELSQRMADQAESLAAYLLPGGKRRGNEWKAGNTDGGEGDSLSVCIKGAKAGVWSDFASGEKGDLLDLWRASRGCSLPEAMQQASAYLGIRDSMPPNAPAPKSYRRPEKPRCQTPKSKVHEWLIGRGLTAETLKAFKIGEQLTNGKAYAVFPYITDDGELVNVKYRNPEVKKDMRQEVGAMPCLFGWHLIDPNCRTVAITEGEIDAMSLHQAGFPALSCNAGAGNHAWIESDWEKLDRFSQILIFYDTDESGEKGAREVIQRLGMERCLRVKFTDGSKDANEYLQKGADRSDFDALIQAAQPLDPEELRSIADFTGEVKASFYPAEGAQHAPRLRLDQDFDWFEFRGGEVTLWTGINGHGKSMLLSQVGLGLMQQGAVFCVFSGEMKPVRQLKRMVKQATGIDRPTVGYIDAVGDWLRERCWVFDQVGTAKIDRLIEVFTYAARRYGMTHCVIDSLMMTDVPDDGPRANTEQKQAIAKLCGFAKQFNVHVHLVAHPRKGRDESASPGKMDVAGSGHLTNGVDNIFAVWKAPKDELKPGEALDKDAKLDLLKQREDGVQNATVSLWFYKPAMQYRASFQWRPLSYVNYSAQEANHDRDSRPNRSTATDPYAVAA